jgi:glyoxylase-like metal-dependent hydrolase (beta-lactamase superfamily II)
MQTEHPHYEPMHMALHDRCFPHRLMEGVWLWSVYSEEKELHFNGYLVQTGAHESFLIDPPCGGPEVLDAFTPLPKPQFIILTNADHERASAQFRERFGIPIGIHEQDAPHLQLQPDRTFRDGEEIADGWQVIHLSDQKTPGESAIYHAERQILALGDALLGKPLQHLSMLPADKYTDRNRAVSGLQRLTTLNVKAVLTGDGDPVMQNANSLIQDALITH